MTTENNDLPLIFISYSSEDAQLAKCIDCFLHKAFKNRLNTFLDVKVSTGDLWHNEISERLDRSEIFILLVSNESMGSINVAREVAVVATKCLRNKNNELQWTTHKKFSSESYEKESILFLPIILEEINDIYACIKQNVQWQDFRNPYDLYEQLEKLAHSIENYLERDKVSKPNSARPKSNKQKQHHLYSDAFSEIPLELRNNDHRKAQFVSKVLHNSTIQLLAESNRKLNNFFDINNTSNVLLAPYTISHREKATKSEVWVVSENLNNDLYDEPISKSVQENMREKKVLYHYFVRDNKKAHLNQQLSKNIPAELRNQYKITTLPNETLMPFEELVVYDPGNEELRWGYMQMTYESSRSNQPVFMLCPSQLVDESIQLLRSCYSGVTHKPIHSKNDIANSNEIQPDGDTSEKDLLEQCIKVYLKSLQINKNDTSSQRTEAQSQINGLVEFFLEPKERNESEIHWKTGEERLAKYIASQVMVREPLNLRMNHDLHLEKQALIRALKLAWDRPSINTNDVLSNEDYSYTSFLSNFISKINDISSIKSAQDSLVTPEKISTQERAAIEEVMIISPLLYNDLYEQEVEDSIASNIKAIIKGERSLSYNYFYFYPKNGECGHKTLKGRDGDLYDMRKKAHQKVYTKYIASALNSLKQAATPEAIEEQYNKIFSFYSIPHSQVIFPFNEIVIFDPNDNQCNWGYMQLNYGDQQPEKVAMKLPQRVLTKLCNILLLHKRNYGSHQPSQSKV